MLKRIFSYGFVEAIAKGLNKLVLLLLPFFLSTADFGKVGLIVSVETLLPIVSLIGFERVILRFYHLRQDYYDFDSTISRSILVSHVVILISILIAYLCGARSLLGLELISDWVPLIILVYLQGVNTIVLNKFRVLDKHSDYYKTRLFLQIGKFILIIFLVWLTKDYHAYLIGGIIIALIINLRYRADDKESSQKFNSNTFKSFIVFSWPFVFHGISMNLLGNADKFIIAKFLDLPDVGLYTFIYSIGSMVVFAFLGISVYMEPMIYKAKDNVEKELLLHKFKVITLAFGLLMYLLIAVISINFLPKLYPDYASVVDFIPYIALSHLLFPYYLSANYRMIYDMKTVKVAMSSLVACAVNIGLNFYLIPIYGIFAAVSVTFISYLIQALGFVLVSNCFKLSFEFLEIIIFGTIIFICIQLQVDFVIVFLLCIVYLLAVTVFRKVKCYA